MPREKSAGAIIYRMKDNITHYLLLHYHGGHWEFARGHLDKGEDEMQTVLREVEEETGIKDLAIVPGFKGYSRFFFRRVWNLKPKEKESAPWVFKLVILYLAETKTEEVKISKEHQGFAWLPYEEAIKKLPKDAKRVFKQAHEYLVSKESV